MVAVCEKPGLLNWPPFSKQMLVKNPCKEL